MQKKSEEKVFSSDQLAGVVRIELTPTESEAVVLPLHHTPT